MQTLQSSSTQDMYVCQYCAAFPCVLVTCICILHVLELPCLYLLCALKTRVCASSRHVLDVLRAAEPVLALRPQDTCVCASSRHVLDVLRLYLLCALETRVCVH
jgi:hypothetical protein